MTRSLVIRASVTGVIILGAPAAFLCAQENHLPQLGSYGQLSTYCGHASISVNAKAIPEIGCFILSSGHSALGTFAGHQVNVSVDADGKEVFAVDGTLVTETFDRTKVPSQFTNLAFVHVQGVAGYGVCQVATDDACPVSINVFDRRSDKSILFTVSQCLPPNYRTCVLTKENWDYELSRLSGRGE